MLIIKEGAVERLVNLAENHNNSSKIRLQCCWVLSFFSTASCYGYKISPDYQLIVSLLCRIMASNLIIPKPLFYKVCWSLTGSQTAKSIMGHRVYEKIFAVDIQTDKELL